MGNHASQYSEGVLESTGESLSLAEEEIFESSSASSISDEQKSSRFSIGERHVSKASLNAESLPSNECHATTNPLSTPHDNNCSSTLEIVSNLSNKFALVSNPIDTSAKCSESDCVSFETTEKVSLFGSSFGSSSSSIVNVSHHSEENEESAEASLLQCIEKIEVLLSIVSSDHSISSSSLKSLQDLYQSLGVFLSSSQELGANETILSKGNADSQSIMHTYNIFNQSECEDKSDVNIRHIQRDNHNFVLDKENMSKNTISDHSHFSQSKKNSVETIIDDNCASISLAHNSKGQIKDTSKMHSDQFCINQNLNVVETNDFKLKHFLPEGKQVVTDVKDKSTEKEAECMFIAERVSVQPHLMTSLVALQASTGGLLTDADTYSGTFPVEPKSGTTVMASPKKKTFQSCAFSSSLYRSPTRTTVPVFEQTKGMCEHENYPGVLTNILNHDKSAAAIGKAVIKNALGFQKYAELFKIALNQDLVASAIGKALCKSALSLEDTLRGTDVVKTPVQKNQVVNTCDKNIFKPVDNRNKENETPAIEHLFKQTPCKRKLALEEETRRIKCLALSPKQTYSDKLNYDISKSSKTLKHLGYNESEMGFDRFAKSKKKSTLQEIFTNDQVIKNNGNKTKCFSPKYKPDKNPSRVKCQTQVFDKWTIVKTDDKEILEFDESDEETSFCLQSNSRVNLSQGEVQERETEDCVQIDSYLMTGICSVNSQSLDQWDGVYYFVNKYIFCSICNVNIFNYLRVLDHVNSETHKTNIAQQCKVDPSFINVGAMLQSVWDRIELNLGKALFCKLIQFEDDTFSCSLCNITAHGHLNVIAHVHAKSHQSNVLQKIYSSTGRNSQQGSCTDSSRSKISWPDSISTSSSNSSISEKEGSIGKWLPSTPSLSSFSESDLSGIYYFAKNYVFCSVCNINMFNSSIVLGHVRAKSHQANKALQKQIELGKTQANVLHECNKLSEIWSQIERTLGGTLFHVVLCIDNNADFFCDLCNIQIINPNHMGVLDHVCNDEHNKTFCSSIQDRSGY